MSKQPILDKVFEADVCFINKESDGTFTIIDGCDHYYSLNLNKVELLQLAAELIELANKE